MTTAWDTDMWDTPAGTQTTDAVKQLGHSQMGHYDN